MAMRWVTTNVRIAPSDYADLQRLAAASGQSLAECIRLALGDFLSHPPGGPAREAQPAYGPVEQEQDGIPAVVRGRTLELTRRLPGYRDGDEVAVRVLGAAEVAERQRHRRAVAEILAEFERLPPGKPAPATDDDRELYR